MKWTVALALTVALTAESPCSLCLYGPDNMAFGSSGTVYLVDTDGKTHSRIVVVSPRGQMLAQWHRFAAGTDRRYGPEGIASTPSGQILVTDAGRGQVLKLSSSGEVLGTLGAAGAFSDLGHVAVDSSGAIYVAQAEPNLIEKFSSSGMLLASWHRPKGAKPDQWSGPESIAATPENHLVVEDWANRRVEILSASGKTLSIFGHAGRAPGDFLNTAGLAVDQGGDIYVADMTLHRVQRFNARGDLVEIIGNTSDKSLFVHGGPTSVAVDESGNLYSADGLSVLKYSPRGTLFARWE